MTASASLHVLIEGFFLEWMGRDRNLSGNTIASYRDAFSLFFRWLQEARGIDPADAIMADLSAANVNDFLVYLAEGRGCSAKTVNCRLAAFWSFAGYAMRKAPQHIGQLAEISKIPSRKARRREIDFLTPDEVGWMAECCEPGSDTELMVAMLYNSGARISELVALRVEDVRVSQKGSCHVHFLGKGRKDRTVPLWDDTSRLLLSHIERRSLKDGDYIFAGRNVDHLTRSGARSRLDAVAKRAKAAHPELARKKVTPHVFRHSTAMAMLAAGVDIATVAIWLGHEDINTTHKYVVSDMTIKEEALSKVRRNWNLKPRKRYKANRDVLDFLNSL